MKSSNILRISILPLMIVIALSVSNLQPPQGKGKNDKEQGESGGGAKNSAGAGNASKGNTDTRSKGQGNGNKAQGDGKTGSHGQGKEQNDNRGQGDGNHGQGNANTKQGRGNDGRGHGSEKNNHGNDKQHNMGRGNAAGNNHEKAGRGKMYRGNGNSVTMNGKRDTEIDWGFDDFNNRRRPGQKKVTICHHTGGVNSEYPVTISISENAVQAHLNHGDQLGNCSVNYGDRWSADYLESRQDVYNRYEQAWETMSFSEALLNYAAQRLLGVRTDLDRNRVNYTSQDIQRRESLIYELQNNVNALENQLGYTRERLDSDVNIIIQL